MEQLTNYDPDGGFDATHRIKLSYMKGEATAELICEVGGNVCGAHMLRGFTDDDYITAVVGDPINDKHASFFDDEDLKTIQHADVEYVIFHDPSGHRERVSGMEAHRYLVGVQIVGYQPE